MKKLFPWILLATCIAILASCSTSHKIKTTSIKKYDSTGTSLLQKSGISQVDSITSKQQDQTNTEEILINFVNENSKQDPVEQANELTGINSERLDGGMGSITIKPKKLHTVTIAGKVISSSNAIKSIAITTQGKTSIIDLTQINKKDSGQISDQHSSDISKEDIEKTKDKKTSGANGLIIIGLAAVILFFIIVAIRIGAVKKLRKDLKS